MSCVLTFKIGNGEPIPVSHDGTLVTDDIDMNLMEFLKNTSEWESISQAIELLLRDKVGTYNQVSISDLTGEQGLIPNANVQFLQDQFPDIIFPENIQAKVLFLDNLRIGTNKYFGRVIKSDGSELFIIENNDYAVEKFAKFLYLQSQLKNGFVFSEDSDQYKILDKLKGDKTINELIEDFSINKDKYKTKIVTLNDKKVLVYPYLESILRTITNVPLRIQYDDDFTNDITSYLEYKTKNGKTEVKLNIENLYKIITTTNPSILPKDVTSSKKFKQYFGTNEHLSEEDSKIYKNGYHKLLSELLHKSFPYVYSKSDAINISFQFPSRKIKDKFDIAYQTITAMEIVNDNFQGYKIYAQNIDGNKYYFPSRHYLVEDDMVERFETIEEAKEYIINKNKQDDIRENSYIEFNQTPLQNGSYKSPKFLPEGKIIEIKHKELPDNFKNVYHEHLLRKGNNRTDFERVVNGIKTISGEFLPEDTKNYILDNIVTPEDMALFILDLKQTTTVEEIKQIVDSITKLEKKAYYVESRKYAGNKTEKLYEYKLIETESTVVEQYKKQKNIPTIKLFKGISQSFKAKFGVDITVLNRDQLQEQFPGMDEGVKAFIKDGNIYINSYSAKSSDLLHEYTHLLLGVLKSNPDSASVYEQLLNMVAESKEKDVRITMEQIEENYPDLSVMDKREELFAELFGRYLSGRGSDIDHIFKQQDKFLKHENQNIFDLNSDTDLKSIYNKTLSSIFERFSSDVATKLKEDSGLDFSETINSRKKSNWLSKQIKDGNIREDCNG